MCNKLEEDIAIIILNYCNYKLTEECINNLLDLQLKCKIILVDNNSPNESYKYLYNYYKKIECVDVIKTENNNGYADGNNYGIRYIADTYKNIKFICIMNPDVKVTYKDLFSNLAEKLNKNDDIAAISPIMLLNGKVDSSNFCWNKPTKRTLILDHLIIRKKNNTAPMKGIFAREDGVAIVGVIPGSFFMVKKCDVEKVGFLDSNTFLYNEENILSIKFSKIGLKEALSINDFYFHNHTPSIKSKTINEKLNANKIVYNSRKYLASEYYNDKLLIVLLKLTNIINEIYILLAHVPSKIKKIVKDRYR